MDVLAKRGWFKIKDLKVKKKDGELEPFSFDKLIASMTKAGLNIEEAENTASEIKNWVVSSSGDGTVESSKIRDKVIEVVAKVDPAASDSYKAHKKT